MAPNIRDIDGFIVCTAVSSHLVNHYLMPKVLGAVVLPSDGGTPAPLAVYEEFTSSGVVRNVGNTGDFFTAGQTIDISITRIGSLVSLEYSLAQGTQNGELTAALVGILPVRLRPPNGLFGHAVVTEGGIFAPGISVINDANTGNIEFAPLAGAWDGASANTVIGGGSMVWHV